MYNILCTRVILSPVSFNSELKPLFVYCQAEAFIPGSLTHAESLSLCLFIIGLAFKIPCYRIPRYENYIKNNNRRVVTVIIIVYR